MAGKFELYKDAGRSDKLATLHTLRQQMARENRTDRASTVAGVMAAHGLSVQELHAHTRADGMALEVIRLYDQFGRLGRDGGTVRVSADLRFAHPYAVVAVAVLKLV